MATLLLQAAGSFLGGLFGATGATIGAAAGAYGGYLLDQALINSTKHIQGKQLSSPQVLTGEEGAPLAKIYGTVRQGGTLIWATRFEEASKTERSGSKGGGPKVTTFTYFANLAIAICEGEIAHVRRIWADGKELDLTDHTIRIYKGTPDQLPDPLIEAKQGTGNAPAYRGTAYAVFDRFALENFGNRIPQIQFEVIRKVGGIADDVKATTIIPGSTEFGLAPSAISQIVRPGETVFANRHVLHAGSDWEASIDELQALCPNLKQVALVVSWFGNDLRAGNCQIKPRVSTNSGFLNDAWRVAGLTRGTAEAATLHQGSAAYGGSPDDASVIAAIADLRARGLKVTLYPFVLMDIPAINTQPSPYGGASQPAYPWRGDITCMPAPGTPGTVDATAAATTQISSFAGAATANQFTVVGNTIAFSGGADWGYRRFILHYAKLAQLAGGVDAFLVGSEFKALTRVRGTSGFPFVDVLSSLASEVRLMLGTAVKLTYAADWSEYGAYSPPGTNNLHFHLDSLWSNSAINAVGIDNYMPLADWRDADWDGNNPDGAASPNDAEALQRAIGAGEGFDWYYANSTDRTNRQRTPIVDGLAGKHWIYRFKDLQGWWENSHYERINGVESGTPTAWVPKGKPFWFTELGCPAIDKGPNQPNVFPDPKSSAAATPYFSNGGRDDEAQSRFIAAHFAYWANPANNPLSNQYAGRMLDLDHTYLWAWDARPFPAFPLNGRVWADGANYLTGHWLNGRLSNVALQDLVASTFMEHGIQNFDVNETDALAAGLMIDLPSTARETLDALLALFRVDVIEQAGVIKLRSRERALPGAIAVTALAFDRNDEAVEEQLNVNPDLVPELSLDYRDALRDYQQSSALSRIGTGAYASQTISLPLVMDSGEAQAVLRKFHRDQSTARKTVSFGAGWNDAALLPGDLISLPDGSETYRITKISDGQQRQIEAETVLKPMPRSSQNQLPEQANIVLPVAGPPLSVFLDLPLLPTAANTIGGLYLAAWSKPWLPVVALASPVNESFVQKLVLPEPAIFGTVVSSLQTNISGRYDRRGWLEINLFDGGLSSVTELQLLNGANAAAVKCANGYWELLQFAKATEVSAGRWRLETLLRGQIGTDNAMFSSAAAGAQFVVIDSSVTPCNLNELDASIALNWKTGPIGKEISDTYFDNQVIVPATRSKTANSPVHVRAKKVQGGDTQFSWIRRGCLNADSWDAAEIPLVEPSEGYRIRVLASDGSVKRTVEVNASQWNYLAAERLADFGAGATIATIEVSQISANGLSGLARTLTVSFS